VFILTVYGDPGPNNEVNSLYIRVLHNLRYGGASGEGRKLLVRGISHENSKIDGGVRACLAAHPDPLLAKDLYYGERAVSEVMSG
jgi:hypothetical protein